MNNLDQYYKILGLQPGASLEEVKQAYKDLAFIWHPDRIPKDNQRLLEKAVAKLQQINLAREQLQPIYNNGNHYKRKPHSSPSRAQREPQKSYHQSSSRYYYHERTDQEPKQAYYQPHYQSSRRPYYKDLTGADLRGANLTEKDLSGRNLHSADLSNADLSDSFLHKIILEGANLFRANLFRANLLQANLKSANLREANLIGADLSGADLSWADLRGAKVGTGDRIMVKLTAVNLNGTILPDGRIHY
ncbi:MAG: DnaJ domain-containing protein [Moorea sp. SIO2B7]|nr:DnaJ domain-containing protein [Moorena sp. SIO2B7]